MDDMVKVAALAITAALCACVVKKQVRELGLVLALAAGALILGMAFQALSGLGVLLDSLSGLAGLSPAVLSPVFKTVGISILTKITAELCRDAGEGGIASFVETAGTVLALAAALPLVRGVVETMAEMLI